MKTGLYWVLNGLGVYAMAFVIAVAFIGDLAFPGATLWDIVTFIWNKYF